MKEMNRFSQIIIFEILQNISSEFYIILHSFIVKFSLESVEKSNISPPYQQLRRISTLFPLSSLGPGREREECA